MQHLTLDPSQRPPLLSPEQTHPPTSLPAPKKSHTHPRLGAVSEDSGADSNGSVFFIGTATTVIEWAGLRLLTDPNFLHAGDHVHLGPGVRATRQTDPAVGLDALPPLDAVLLSHYHADHFDQLVEARLNRAFPIVTTPHAKECLTARKEARGEEPFTAVRALDFFESLMVHVGTGVGAGGEGSSNAPAVKVTGMPGKHVPPGPLSVANDILQAVPPTNGWLLELGNLPGPGAEADALETGYRIYISGDTLLVDELKEIPKWLKDDKIDLMLVHLGGTTIPGPSAPLLMVTMDAKQGIQLMRLVDPDVTIPIHYDDYDVFLSPLSDFKEEIKKAGFEDKVVYLDRGEEYRFKVRS